MKVKAIWEFDADMEGLNPDYVDIPKLAKDLTRLELAILLDKKDIRADDFEYIVEETEPAELTEETIDEFTQFKTRSDAVITLDRMKQLTEWYGYATRADFMKLIGVPHTEVDDRFGWVGDQLLDARILRTRLGWYIEFPELLEVEYDD